jgi:hypothetical protein
MGTQVLPQMAWYFGVIGRRPRRAIAWQFVQAVARQQISRPGTAQEAAASPHSRRHSTSVCPPDARHLEHARGEFWGRANRPRARAFRTLVTFSSASGRASRCVPAEMALFDAFVDRCGTRIGSGLQSAPRHSLPPGTLTVEHGCDAHSATSYGLRIVSSALSASPKLCASPVLAVSSPKLTHPPRCLQALHSSHPR